MNKFMFLRRVFVFFLCITIFLPLQFEQVVNAATISLPNAITLYVGEGKQLYLDGTTKKPIWSTSNKNVVSVSTNGEVKALSKGKATITATLDTKKFYCKVTVKEYTKYSVKINQYQTYSTASKKVTEPFTDGQSADLALSSFGINRAKNATTYNHPNGIATDGTHFFVCDTWNNRVLIYDSIPTDGSEKPSLVLGQKDFKTSYAGYELNEMNWPVGVAVAKGKLYVTDTHNNRILVWNQIPTESGIPADYAITKFANDSEGYISWPWAIWTDGNKMIVTNTRDGKLLIWNSVPTQDDFVADLVIPTGGTPRTIITDGHYLLIGDHNIDDNGMFAGCRVWTSFPTSNNDLQDFTYRTQSEQPGGCIVNDQLVLLHSGRLYLYDHLPTSTTEMNQPKVVVGNGKPNDDTDQYYYFGTGNYNQCLYANGTLFAALYNSNKIVAFKELPKNETDQPSFALGATVNGNTLSYNGLIMNPNVATNGKSLVAVSDYDWTISIWKNIPDKSSVKADIVYTLDPLISPKDVVLYKEKLVVATNHSLLIWSGIPTKGQKWKRSVSGKIGSVFMTDIDSIAMDQNYFYISDAATNKIYIYESIPYANTKPIYTISNMHGSIQSNGSTLVVTNTGLDGGLCKRIYFYDISDLTKVSSQSINGYRINGELRNFSNASDGLITSSGQLIVTDNNENYVLIWDSWKDAINGNDVVITLGHGSDYYTSDEIPGANKYYKDSIGVGGSNSLCMPTYLAYDGRYLWVGEYKLSSRLLRFSGTFMN